MSKDSTPLIEALKIAPMPTAAAELLAELEALAGRVRALHDAAERCAPEVTPDLWVSGCYLQGAAKWAALHKRADAGDEEALATLAEAARTAPKAHA